MSDWISVDQELPVAGILVLAANADYQTVCYWNGYKNYWQRGIDKLHWNPTYWKPLDPIPAPPEPKA